MSTDVVNAIADKLGIAAEQVQANLAELWPLYVQAVSAQCIGSSAIMLLVFVVSTISLVLALKAIDTDDLGDGRLIALGLICCALAVLAVVSLMVLVVRGSSAIAVIISPDGYAMMTILDSIGGE